jgi:hypothetical protein
MAAEFHSYKRQIRNLQKKSLQLALYPVPGLESAPGAQMMPIFP